MRPNTPLRDPSAYFEQRPEPVGIGLAVWAAHVVAVLVGFVGIMWMMVRRTENLPPGVWSEMSSMLVGMGFVIVLIAGVALLVVAGIMHAASNYGGGDGNFMGAVAVAGWSYAPDLLETPVTYAWAWLQFRGRTFDASDPSRWIAEVEAVMDSTTGLDIVLSLAVVGWSVYILAYGTAKTHDVPLEKTIWPAVIIGFFAFIFRLTG